MGDGESAAELCGCGHLLDPHVLVALTEATVSGVEGVPVGGVMFCPGDCECSATWSVGGYPPPVLPGPVRLRWLRAVALAGPGGTGLQDAGEELLQLRGERGV
jgi:hypothetical protein